jgi:O-antigen/teichoic acid export membrane protein
MLALLDQAVVSGTSFLTTVLVGRFAGQTQLGVYSLGFTVLVLIVCVQDSLIAAPYTVFGNQLEGPARAEYAGTVLVHHWLLSLAALLGLAMAGSALLAGSDFSLLGAVLLVLSGAVPFVLMREFRRRLAFAHLHVGSALALDSCVTVLQLGLLAALALSGALTAVTGHAAVGLACALVGGVALIAARKSFVIRRSRVVDGMRRGWNFGRWIVLGQLVGVAHGFVLYWLAAMLEGVAAAGVIAACMTVVTLSNPFVLGVSNLLGPHAAQAYATGGCQQVRRVVARATLWLGAVMASFTGAVFLAGPAILRLLYGRDYSGYGLTVSLLALATLAGSLGIAFDHGLRVLERPDLAFRVGLMGFTVTLVSAALLTFWWGTAGAAGGYLLGSTTGTAARAIAFRALLARANGGGP